MSTYIAAIDQGTTSTRCIVFDHAGSIISIGQLGHEQLLPKAGWVEDAPAEIWTRTREVHGHALPTANSARHGVADFGFTYQRNPTPLCDMHSRHQWDLRI